MFRKRDHRSRRSCVLGATGALLDALAKDPILITACIFKSEKGQKGQTGGILMENVTQLHYCLGTDGSSYLDVISNVQEGEIIWERRRVVWDRSMQG